MLWSAENPHGEWEKTSAKWSGQDPLTPQATDGQLKPMLIIHGHGQHGSGVVTWVCLKIGYIPNYSHLIGIMISKTIGFFGVHTIFRQTHFFLRSHAKKSCQNQGAEVGITHDITQASLRGSLSFQTILSGIRWPTFLASRIRCFFLQSFRWWESKNV